MLQDFEKLARHLLEGNSIDDTTGEMLGREKLATNKREFQELRQRIKTLTPKQVEILATGSRDAQKQITHLALVKTYRLYKEFVIEVLGEKMQVFDYPITDLDYNSFISRKKIDHPELETIAITTQKKVKTVMFRMLQQVGLIDSVSKPMIQIPLVEPDVEQSVLEEDPALLTCFFYDETRIRSLI